MTEKAAAEALEWALSLAEWPFPIPRKAIEERIAELRAQAAAAAEPVQVAWANTMPLIDSSAERVALLEGLLLDVERYVTELPIGERIRAALGE